VLIVTALIAGAIGRHVLCWRTATGALRKRLAAG
jgi:hypothetical protein